jgi:hypothetical protein
MIAVELAAVNAPLAGGRTMTAKLLIFYGLLNDSSPCTLKLIFRHSTYVRKANVNGIYML